jgi:hypothetical protein
MAFEYKTGAKVLRVTRLRRRRAVEFDGRRSGDRGSPDAATVAAARHETGPRQWDKSRFDVPEDVLDWRPTGDSL